MGNTGPDDIEGQEVKTTGWSAFARALEAVKSAFSLSSWGEAIGSFFSGISSMFGKKPGAGAATMDLTKTYELHVQENKEREDLLPSAGKQGAKEVNNANVLKDQGWLEQYVHEANHHPETMEAVQANRQVLYKIASEAGVPINQITASLGTGKMMVGKPTDANQDLVDSMVELMDSYEERSQQKTRSLRSDDSLGATQKAHTDAAAGVNGSFGQRDAAAEAMAAGRQRSDSKISSKS